MITVNQILPQILVNSDSAYDVTATIDDNVVTLISHSTLFSLLFTKYVDWAFYKADDSIDFDRFFRVYIWEIFKVTHLDNWKRIYEALKAEYSPIENYDRMENITNTNNAGKTLSVKTTMTSGGTTYGSTITDTDNDRKEQVGTSTFDSQTIRPESEIKYTGNTAHTHTGKDLNEYSGSDSTNTEQLRDSTETIVGRIHGNIGVTTNQQMINQELELRNKAIIENMIVEELIKEYFILWDGDNNDSDFI